MSKVTLKLRLGIKAKNAPVFIEGEPPGVIATREYGIEAGKVRSKAQMAQWALGQEDAIIEECIECTWVEDQ